MRSVQRIVVRILVIGAAVVAVAASAIGAALKAQGPGVPLLVCLEYDEALPARLAVVRVDADSLSGQADARACRAVAPDGDRLIVRVTGSVFE